MIIGEKMVFLIKKSSFILLVLMSIPVLFLPAYGIDPSHYLRVRDYGINRQEIARSVTEGLMEMRNPRTKMVRSHWGHPGFERLGFLYDNSVAAMVLNSAGYKQEAEDILDYIVAKYRMPKNWIEANEDCHNLFGIIKLLRADSGARLKSVINTIDIENESVIGKGLFEYNTTPGPVSYLIFALLSVNPDKYLSDAANLGYVLLSFQRDDGAVVDGDRNRERVYTESHMDAHAAFRMLYGFTKLKKWKTAADRAMDWFKKNVYESATGRIYQGLWESGWTNKAFAADSYSWLMAGPAGDELPVNEIRKIADHWLDRVLTRITLKLPDQSTRTLVLTDFTDPTNEETIQVRDGFHPLGSPEWTGGAVLALQKTSVRLWNAGDRETARTYKSLAEILMNQVFRSYYRVPGMKGMITFYSTGQSECVGPFGNGTSPEARGWITPLYYIDNSDPSKKVMGGSAIGSWPMMIFYGMNPFQLNDPYRKTYDKIDLNETSELSANEIIERSTATRTWREKVPTAITSPVAQIMEPNGYSTRIWDNLSRADRSREKKDSAAANTCYRKVIDDCLTVLNDTEWVRLAKFENGIKRKEIGGLVWYPWGKTYANNDSELLNQVLRYPILNELSVAVYGLVVANYELGNLDETKRYMELMMDDYSLHQIAVLDNSGLTPRGLISGFWNALVSWEDSLGYMTRDGDLGKIFAGILRERRVRYVKPETVFFELTKRYHELHERLAFNLSSEEK